jgi:hypothetical protein
MSEHEAYEILCALVASGHASADEVDQLRLHLPDCEHCRNLLPDFAQVSGQALPLHSESHTRGRVPTEMTNRFLARAKAEGIPVRPALRLWPAHIGLPQLAWTVTAAVAIMAGFLTINARRTPAVKPHAGSLLSQASGVSPAPNVQSSSLTSDDPARIAQLLSQLLSSQQEIGTLERKIVALQQELKASDSTRADLSSRLAALGNDNTSLRMQVSEKGSRLVEVENQLKQKDSVNADEIAELVKKQADLEKLSNQLSEREKDLEHERQLLAASAQARDLITARNLHIIDVHDNDQSGRQRPFGRIFYTEGQSLVFYAYDLEASGRLDAKATFHVWGGALGNQQVKNLGIFRSEDSKASRWVLTCDDPHVLAQIDTVFVTVESRKDDLDHPKGKRILFAFLGDQPNHP